MLRFENPSSPYEQFYPEHLDFAWRDQDGRTIGVLTECNDEGDVSLETAQRGLAESVQGARIKSQTWTQVDKIKALRTVIHSREPKSSTVADVVLFRARDCTFVLTYVAPLAKFNSGTDTFARFLATVEVQK